MTVLIAENEYITTGL